MHLVEPYWNWRSLYVAEDDPRSPFFGREYSEFVFKDAIYNYVIHPQWDSMESQTLFLKILYSDYDKKYAIIELMGEWNDTLYNDIMFFKRNVIDHMLEYGINYFILIGENVLNFHSSDDSYYEEWFEDVESGWIALINFRDHVLKEFGNADIDQYFVAGGELNEQAWRTYKPDNLFVKVSGMVNKRIGG